MEAIIQAALVNDQSGVIIMATVFSTGLLTSLTPCIYPMLPITVSVIANQAKSNKQSIIYSFIYVLGLATVYAGLGILAASTGQLFGTVASHPVTLLFVAGFCLLMSAWLLGWLSFPMPTIHKQFTFSFAPINIFIAGCLSGLVMAPCTSPVLGMLLMYVAADGDRLWAALLLFIFAFGMSALLILAGSVSGFVSSLPKSGKWLNVSKWVMAIMMAAVAVYLINNAMPL